MRYMKPVLTMLAVLLISFIVVAPVNASAPEENEPVFTIDDDVTEVSDWTTLAPVMGEYVPPEGLSAEAAITPLYPVSANVYTKTPKFYFSKVAGAVKYKLAVYDVFGAAWVYDDYTDTGTCGVGYCWLQPTTKLKTLAYPTNSRGVYRWQVAAYTGTNWVVSTDDNYFWVYSTGFSSTFDGSAKKWIPIGGTWTLTSGGYYKTLGLEGGGSAALHSEYFSGDYVYEIRLKRKNTTNATRIYWNGAPDPLSGEYRWLSGYYISYTNTNNVFIYEAAGGIGTYMTNFNTPYVNPLDWNTFTIWYHYASGMTYIYVNGIFLGYIDDSSFFGGYVGVQMTQLTLDKTPLLIDYAKAYYTSTGPSNVQYPDGKVLDR